MLKPKRKRKNYEKISPPVKNRKKLTLKRPQNKKTKFLRNKLIKILLMVPQVKTPKKEETVSKNIKRLMIPKKSRCRKKKTKNSLPEKMPLNEPTTFKITLTVNA